MAETVYNKAKQLIMQNLIDLDATDIRAVLIGINKTGVNNPDLTDVAAIDALNAGATTLNANRQALASKVVTVDNTNDWALAGAATITFPAEAFIALGLLYYQHVGAPDSGNIPIMFTDTGFGAGVDLTSGGMTYSLPNGWLKGT
jgi:hypothetical protein